MWDDPPASHLKCDMCYVSPAVKWFQGTSVLLCDAKKCYAECQAMWDKGQSDALLQAQINGES
jgi:hypothetical protein